MSAKAAAVSAELGRIRQQLAKLVNGGLVAFSLHVYGREHDRELKELGQARDSKSWTYRTPTWSRVSTRAWRHNRSTLDSYDRGW